MNIKTLLCMGSIAVILLTTVAVSCAQPDATTSTNAPPIRPDSDAPEPGVNSEQLDSYMAVAPAVLRSGETESISVSLFAGLEPAQGTVRLQLTQNGRPVAEATEFVRGVSSIGLPVPELPPGVYMLGIEGEGASGGEIRDQIEVRLEDAVDAPSVLALETDKPIYKPGQQIHVRTLRLDSELKPAPGQVTVEILDAKGIKVFRQTVEIDDFGMASLELPLSTEPNLGVWKITADSGEDNTQLDVRIEEYALPKYEVTVDVPNQWVLADEPVVGTVSAEYSFGKPVLGEVEVVASRYVGDWEEFATFTDQINGSISFELPAVGYVAGVPASGGQGNLRLDVTVREQATGYEEHTTRLLTVATAPINLQLIPESRAFKPGLPFTLLVVTETPDNRPVDADVNVNVRYFDQNMELITEHTVNRTTYQGNTLIRTPAPENAVALSVAASTSGVDASLAVTASYSPSGNFIHVEQIGDPFLDVGGQARFHVHSTTEARNFYYEVISRGRVVFTDVSPSPDITLDVTPVMTPASRLVVYQILPNNEVAADYLPFTVSASYPMELNVEFSSDEVLPGDALNIRVNTSAPAKVGLVAVDRAVFILAENRLNLRQVFAELERLYAEPQAEFHLESLPPTITTRGAAETFRDAGLVVMTDKSLPAGVESNGSGSEGRRGLLNWLGFGLLLGGVGAGITGTLVRTKRRRFLVVAGLAGLALAGTLVGCGGVAPEVGRAVEVAATAPPLAASEAASGLAEVQRVRQFFPETWLWTDVMTDGQGDATLSVEAPDSITTWKLRAVGISPEHGLGVGEADLRVFQPFFLQMDLPYSAIRGEEFPVKVALYNYLDTAQEFLVELDESPDFQLLDESAKTVSVAANAVSGVEFDIRLTQLGNLPIKITARSQESADAVIKNLLVEPEGVARESVDNVILADGNRQEFDTTAPPGAIPGSDRTYVALTGSYLSQTIDGLENLLQMPYGCGEQNMVLFAPNVFVARYLQETDQLKPEVMAKAEHLMTTGYQRELTYRRHDGSFSAFGDSDDDGSLWLTAFVLKSFAQANGLIYVDEIVLDDAISWILSHQRGNGSFEPVGFLHHQELLGGLQGNTALTAYVAIALMEAGVRGQANAAISHLERQLSDISDAYTLAIVSYALELAGSPHADVAYEQLMSKATTDEEGLHWGPSNAVETTGYATLALLERGDSTNAPSAARWLVTQRNAFGGYGSTQDTVVGLQALIEFAATASFEMDLAVELSAGSWVHQVTINSSNADVVQIVDVPCCGNLQVAATGTGRAVTQVVHRFNLPEVERADIEMFQIDVDYGTEHVEVDDTIEVTANLMFTPPGSGDAGMIVLDVAVPTGFAPAVETVQALVIERRQIKRYEIAGRKVILYIEDLKPGEPMQVRFDARALYPVRAQPVTSEVYSYYNPHWRGETLGSSVIVTGE